MQIKSVNNAIIIIFAMSALSTPQKRICDTTMWGKDTVVECIENNCPNDSTVICYMKTTISKEIFYYCKDSSVFVLLTLNGDTITHSYARVGKTIGLRRIYFTKGNPKRFTNFSSTGQKDGWEVFWYSNGNVKDSILFRNDSTIARSSFYLNGRKQVIERDIYGPNGYSATSYTPKGKKNGAVINGTGAISVCDSIGANCHTLTFKNGKRVFE
jgi:antitoxin component YwqK of YwqJK toxin-antitoxin module